MLCARLNSERGIELKYFSGSVDWCSERRLLDHCRSAPEGYADCDSRSLTVRAGTLFGNLLELFNRNSTGVSILVRETLENVETFENAVEALSDHPIIAPVYYIVGGVSGNDGAVVTRDRCER